MTGNQPRNGRTAGAWLAIIGSIAVLPLLAAAWFVWWEQRDTDAGTEPKPVFVEDAAEQQIYFSMVQACRDEWRTAGLSRCLDAFVAEHPVPGTAGPQR